jgi:hypothetical protein
MPAEIIPSSEQVTADQREDTLELMCGHAVGATAHLPGLIRRAAASSGGGWCAYASTRKICGLTGFVATALWTNRRATLSARIAAMIAI